MKRCFVLAFALTALLCVWQKPVQAAYPDQPITLLCPWDAGGGTDAVARIIGSLLNKELGVPVNVVNRTGGSGVVGHSAIITAKPDGYTIGVATVEMAMMHWAGLTPLTTRDLTPLSLVNMDPAAITVAQNAPWKDYKEFFEYVKANPGKVKSSGTGHGGIWHLAQAAWLVQVGLAPDAIQWIPSKGAAPALQDLAAGGIEMVPVSLPEASSMIEAKKARPLVVMAQKRDPKHPNLPSLADVGLKNWDGVATWRSISGPKGLPDAVVAKLEAALKKATESKEFIDFMNSRGFGIAWMSAKDTAAFMHKADDDFGKVMKEAGLAK